jgi:AcrR family transcriptional regulator
MPTALIREPEAKTTSERLREALAEMAANGTPGALTAAALCERAGLSRNALYRYHPDILQELHAMKQRACSGASPNSRELLRLRQEANDLRLQTTKLAALVDHYFAAWRETCSLLQRRERELADVRRNVQPRVVRVTG